MSDGYFALAGPRFFREDTRRINLKMFASNESIQTQPSIRDTSIIILQTFPAGRTPLPASETTRMFAVTLAEIAWRIFYALFAAADAPLSLALSAAAATSLSQAAARG